MPSSFLTFSSFRWCFLQALEDEMETSSESRSRSSTGISSPLSLPMVRIEVTSPQPNDAQAHSEEPPPRIAADIDRAFMLLDFPDVIKSAESSPRHSLIPLTEFYEHGRNLNQRRTREIINQINAEVAQAISRGQSPYFIYGITDNDEETWCWNSTQTSLQFLGFKKLLSLTLVKRNNKLNGKSSKGRRLQWKKGRNWKYSRVWLNFYLSIVRDITESERAIDLSLILLSF